MSIMNCAASAKERGTNGASKVIFQAPFHYLQGHFDLERPKWILIKVITIIDGSLAH